jgi:hypothetical protein
MNGDNLTALAGKGIQTQADLTAEMVGDFTHALMLQNGIKADFQGLHIEVIKKHNGSLQAIVITPVDTRKGKPVPRFNAESKKLERV